MQLTLRFKRGTGYAMDKGWEPLGGVTQIEIERYKKIIDREDGKLTGYLNGACFLSYHESEMMLKTLGQLV